MYIATVDLTKSEGSVLWTNLNSRNLGPESNRKKPRLAVGFGGTFNMAIQLKWPILGVIVCLIFFLDFFGPI